MRDYHSLTAKVVLLAILTPFLIAVPLGLCISQGLWSSHRGEVYPRQWILFLDEAVLDPSPATPSWSSDGKYLTTAVMRHGVFGTIMVVKADGSETHRPHTGEENFRDIHRTRFLHRR